MPEPCRPTIIQTEGGLERILRLGFLAEQFAEFVADNFHDLLVGRKLQQNFGANGFGAHVRDEFIGDADVDVAFEQRFANFGEAGVQMLFAELALAAKIFEGALQLVCKSFKHYFR